MSPAAKPLTIQVPASVANRSTPEPSGSRSGASPVTSVRVMAVTTATIKALVNHASHPMTESVSEASPLTLVTVRTRSFWPSGTA